MNGPLGATAPQKEAFSQQWQKPPPKLDRVGGRITRPFLGGFGKPLIFVGPAEWPTKRATRALAWWHTDIMAHQDLTFSYQSAPNTMAFSLTNCSSTLIRCLMDPLPPNFGFD